VARLLGLRLGADPTKTYRAPACPGPRRSTFVPHRPAQPGSVGLIRPVAEGASRRGRAAPGMSHEGRSVNPDSV
jgi:hypothetical protein